MKLLLIVVVFILLPISLFPFEIGNQDYIYPQIKSENKAWFENYISSIDKISNLDRFKSLRMLDTLIFVSKRERKFHALTYAYKQQGVNYYFFGNTEKAIDYFLKAATISEQTKDYYYLGSIFNNMAGFMNDFREYDVAIEFFKKAIEYNAKVKKESNLQVSICNLAETYRNAKKLDSALLTINVLLKNLKQYELKNQIRFLLTAANINLDLNNLYETNELLKKSKLFVDKNPNQYVEKVYNDISLQLSFKNRDYVNTINTCHAQLNIIDSNVYNDISLNTYKYLALSFSKLNKKDSALKYYELMLINQDSIFVKNNSYKAIKNIVLYFFNNSNKEFNELSSITEKKDKFLTLMISLLIIILCVLSILILQYKRINKLSKNLIEKNTLISEQSEQILITNENLQNKISEVEDLNSKLESSNIFKDKLIRIIAHDIKNPLSGIYGLADIIASYTNEMSITEIESMGASIKLSTQNLNGLLDNLLQWSKSRSNQQDFQKQMCNIDSLIQTCIDIYLNSNKLKNINIVFNPNLNLINIDINMILTVIRNLINNAIKFSNQNSQIIINSEIKDSIYQFSIKDFGVGISKDNIDTIFLDYDQKSTLGTNNEKGTGLGLVLCRDFINIHDGKIWVESEFGMGSTFYFTLPLV